MVMRASSMLIVALIFFVAAPQASARPSLSSLCSSSCRNGACDANGHCICASGWTGPRCDECIPSPGCMYGTCRARTPGTCGCLRGWIGPRCDVPCAKGADGKCIAFTSAPEIKSTTSKPVVEPEVVVSPGTNIPWPQIAAATGLVFVMAVVLLAVLRYFAHSIAKVSATPNTTLPVTVADIDRSLVVTAEVAPRPRSPPPAYYSSPSLDTVALSSSLDTVALSSRPSNASRIPLLPPPSYEDVVVEVE